MEYEYCHKCSMKYNVSALRDKSKVFIYEDCVRRDAAKFRRRKAKPIYNRAGLATVRNF